MIEISKEAFATRSEPILRIDDKMLTGLLATQRVSSAQTVDSFLLYLAKIGVTYTRHDNQHIVDYAFKLLNCLVSFKPKMEREFYQALEVVNSLQQECVNLLQRCQSDCFQLLNTPEFKQCGRISEDTRKRHQSLRSSLYELLASIGLSDSSDDYLPNSHRIAAQIFEHSEMALKHFEGSPTAMAFVLSDTLKDVVGVMTGISFSEVLMGFLRIAYPKVQELIQAFDSLGDIMRHSEFLMGFMEFNYRLCKLISEKLYKHNQITLTAMINLFQMTSLIGSLNLTK